MYKLHGNVTWEWDLAHSLSNASKLALKSALLLYVLQSSQLLSQCILRGV